jgi:hypothetical protein
MHVMAEIPLLARIGLFVLGLLMLKALDFAVTLLAQKARS